MYTQLRLRTCKFTSAHRLVLTCSYMQLAFRHCFTCLRMFPCMFSKYMCAHATDYLHLVCYTHATTCAWWYRDTKLGLFLTWFCALNIAEICVYVCVCIYIYIYPPANLSYKVCGHKHYTEASILVRLTLRWNPGPRFCSLNLWISFYKGIILVMLAQHENRSGIL